MPYTEMGTTELKLSLIAGHAKRDSKMQFTSLAHLLDKEYLKQCFYSLNRNKAKGVDNVGWYEYEIELDEKYADDFVCVVQYAEDAKQIEEGLKNRFKVKRFELEIHPEKSRQFSFGRFEEENAQKQNRRANSFDFLGFTYFCDKTRKGYFKVGIKTSRKKFVKKCKEMTDWLKSIRNQSKPKEWWDTLNAKLRGHFQYYGVSGNFRSIEAFYKHTQRVLLKWLNRRSQKKSKNWKNFIKYLECYPIAKPKIVHNFYTL